MITIDINNYDDDDHYQLPLTTTTTAIKNDENHSRCSNSLWWWWLFVRLLDIVCGYFERIFIFPDNVDNERKNHCNRSNDDYGKSIESYMVSRKIKQQQQEKKVGFITLHFQQKILLFLLNEYSNYFDLIGYKNYLFIYLASTFVIVIIIIITDPND